ncbi:hypothetical protein ACLX1H_009174 [Fusarium chlamydosporum]
MTDQNENEYHDALSGQDPLQPECLYNPEIPIRFAALHPNVANNVNKNNNNNKNNLHDRLAVEQWQLDSTNAYVDQLASHLLDHQDETLSVMRKYIDLLDAVHGPVEEYVIIEEGFIQRRGFMRKVLAAMCLLAKGFLLLLVVTALVLLMLYVYESYEGDFFELID